MNGPSFTITTHLFALMKGFLRCTNTRKLLPRRPRSEEVRSTLIFVENMVHHSFVYKHTRLSDSPISCKEEHNSINNSTPDIISNDTRWQMTQSFGIFLLHTPLLLVHLRQAGSNKRISRSAISRLFCLSSLLVSFKLISLMTKKSERIKTSS